VAEAVRTALFVDFDQVFGGLHRDWPLAAERFATRPEDWLGFLERGQHEVVPGGGKPRPRRVLLRRCYLNPVGAVPAAGGMAGSQRFAGYRAFFTQTGFAVVDCPPLTAQGKNSADIVMAMDIMDALAHGTRFDEFVILSGDADFTPVLMRIRAHDRTTAILADPFTARAYRAVADLPIRHETFLEQGLKLTYEQREAARRASQRAVEEGPMAAAPGEAVAEAGVDAAPVEAAVAPEAAAAAEATREPVDAVLHRVLGVPLLPDVAYRALFRHLAAILRAAGQGRAVPQSMQAAILHARCAADGQDVPREAAAYVLASLPGEDGGEVTEGGLATRFRDSVRANCQAAGLGLSLAELRRVDAWLGGGTGA
jgi:hypothetical protein